MKKGRAGRCEKTIAATGSGVTNANMADKPTISSIINNALEIVVVRKAEILQSVLVPFVLLSGLDYAHDQEISYGLQLAVSILSLAPYTYFAVIIHRIVLLGPQSIQKWGLPAWTKRETYFFMHLFALIVLSVLVILVFAMIHQIGALLGYIVVTYLVIRLSLVFPASAVDEGVTFKVSWLMTKRHQMLMLYIAVIFPLVLLLPSYFINEISNESYGY